MLMKSFFTLVIFLVSIQSAFAYSGGDGSQGDPYQISNVSDLQTLMEDEENWDKYYILTSDIDGNAITSPQPIGNEVTYFTGSFNGDGYTISNIDYVMENKDYIGFFGHIDGSNNTEVDCAIYNLTLENVNARGKQKVGGFAGFSKGCTISNCTVTGDVYATEWFAGGFSAVNEESTIIDCTATGDVSGVSHVGSFIADNQSSIITNCAATGHATSLDSGDPENDGWYISSFIGWNKESTISNCTATGNATGRFNVAGFVGFSDASVISNCTAEGNVDGIFRVGGFVGDHFTDSEISYCASSGNISGVYNLGGFAGQSDGTITSCYSLGDVITLESETSYCIIGGFIGTIFENGIVEECYSMGNAICNSTSIEGTAIGGFVGNQMGSIKNCSSSGYVIDNANVTENYLGSFTGYDHMGTTENCFAFGNTSSENAAIIGGFVGSTEEASYVCCFWNGTFNPGVEDSGTSDDVGDEVTSLTDMQFFQQASFSCFDFDNIWCIVEGNSYPHLQKIVDCDTITSVEEDYSDNQITIFPNPASDYINIPEIYGTIAIYSTLGIKVMEINNPNGRIDISRLPAGVYYISINGRFDKFVKI